MKKVKKYNDFLNESSRSIGIVGDIPVKDENYKYLLNVVERTRFENTMHFYVKDLIEIGTAGKYKLYLNYLDKNSYEDRLSYWFVYNERPDNLNGTRWDSGVIWEDDGFLVNSERQPLDIKLFPNFIEIIAEEIKSYPNLNEWIEYIKNIGITNRKYHRLAIQNSYKDEKDKTELTWEEKLEWKENSIKHDKLLNRHKKPYEQRDLDEMLKLGEEKYNEKMKKQAASMKKIIDKMFKDGDLKK